MVAVTTDLVDYSHYFISNIFLFYTPHKEKSAECKTTTSAVGGNDS